MTAWTKSNIDIQGTRNVKVEELFVGVKVYKWIFSEYHATNEQNYSSHLISQEDINRAKECDYFNEINYYRIDK